MFSHNVNFEFIGFNPEPKEKNYIILVTDRLQNLAPSDSFMKIKMTKRQNTIEALCRITSQAAEFEAEVMSSNPIVAIRQIENQIVLQLQKWKRCRTLNLKNKVVPAGPSLEVAI